jgi:Na+/H+ antiporter NhaA
VTVVFALILGFIGLYLRYGLDEISVIRIFVSVLSAIGALYIIASTLGRWRLTWTVLPLDFFFPDLNGIWIGKVSSFDSKGTFSESELSMTIKQSWFNISVETERKEGSAKAKSFYALPDKANDTALIWTLYRSYSSDPGPGLALNWVGASTFHYEHSAGQLVGHYWSNLSLTTGTPVAGSFTLARVSTDPTSPIPWPTGSVPRERNRIIDSQPVPTPVQEFVKSGSSSVIVLLAAAMTAFVWANSPFAASYLGLKDLQVGIGFRAWSLQNDLILWVNDLLIAIFFFVVGLTFKSELLVGELGGWGKVLLPAAGALGGMAVSALIYVAFNLDQDMVRGWVIPMAADVVFAVGVLALLGARVPAALRSFLLALVIVNNLAAMLVIALFYTNDLSTGSLLLSLVAWGVAVSYGRADGRSPLVYAILGAICWYFMLKSGVHATIAGLLMALAVPLNHQLSESQLREQFRIPQGEPFEPLESRIEQLERVLDKARSPLHAMARNSAPM